MDSKIKAVRMSSLETADGSKLREFKSQMKQTESFLMSTKELHQSKKKVS